MSLSPLRQKERRKSVISDGSSERSKKRFEVIQSDPDFFNGQKKAVKNEVKQDRNTGRLKSFRKSANDLLAGGASKESKDDASSVSSDLAKKSLSRGSKQKSFQGSVSRKKSRSKSNNLFGGITRVRDNSSGSHSVPRTGADKSKKSTFKSVVASLNQTSSYSAIKDLTSSQPLKKAIVDLSKTKKRKEFEHDNKVMQKFAYLVQ